MRGDQVGQPAGRHGARLGTELASDPGDDLVHLAREPVDEAGLSAAAVVFPITAEGAEKSTRNRRAALAESASIEISMPGARTPPSYSPAGETTSKFVDVPKSTTMHGAP